MTDRQSGTINVHRFDKVDASGEVERLLAFLDRVEAMPQTVARRHRAHDLFALGPGMTVAEIGCGLGTVAAELAAIVGPSGKVYGFDLSEQFIAAARARAAQRSEGAAQRSESAARRDEQAALDFQVADAVALPLPDAALDAYRAERVYMHLKSPEAALAEAFRVLRPGGRLLTMDQDWDSLVFDGDLATTRMVSRAFADSLVNGMVARRMRPLLREAGFADIKVTLETTLETDGHQVSWLTGSIAKAALAGGLDPAIVDAWVEDQQRRCDEDRFLLASMHFITTARRPG
jgi:ubiquinone/menaquinone biosynthesis C-methylase UbiE